MTFSNCTAPTGYFLLHQFLSPLSNQRSDEYGGNLQKRMHYPLAFFGGNQRKAWPSEQPARHPCLRNRLGRGWPPPPSKTLLFSQKSS